LKNWAEEILGGGGRRKYNEERFRLRMDTVTDSFIHGEDERKKGKSN
jgi:hypothetical protein